MFEAPLELVFTNVQLANYVWWLERPKHSKILDVRRTKISHKHLPGIFDFSDLNSLNELAALFRRTDINDSMTYVSRNRPTLGSGYL